jgi:cytidylate kinase
VERIMRRVNIMRSRAEERVHGSDGENTWFYRTFFGIDWNGLARPHIVIDTAAVSVPEAPISSELPLGRVEELLGIAVSAACPYLSAK